MTKSAARDDITLLNLNMLYVRYFDAVERELHVPLGPLYLTRALEDAGKRVDFRDYQVSEYDEPFAAESICDYLAGSAELIGVSVMANLLPFAIVALEQLKLRHPQKTIVLGGVGPKSVERKILERFPWIDAIAHGEGEPMVVALVDAFAAAGGSKGGDARFAGVPGLYWRAEDGRVVKNPAAERITDLDAVPFPAWHRIDLPRYDGYGVMTSRGCPYLCTFCSVAPIWGHTAYRRSNANIIAEMAELKRRAGADLFLFQDEFFVGTPAQVVSFCDELDRARLGVDWKAFGRVNLASGEMMARMAQSGCLELRFGIESGSDALLQRVKKGFLATEAVAVVSEAVKHFDRVDAFYVWGFPFETMDDFYQSVFQMVSFRMLGARILPSLLCLLPQTEIYADLGEAGQQRLEFCRELFPEYMLTGHEICRTARVELAEAHAPLFDFIEQHRDLFPGFFHHDMQGNVWPKLRVLQEMGFYPADGDELAEGIDSCGAHSPRVGQATTAKAQLSVS